MQVAILTGFPCHIDHAPPTETDGPSGALAIARALLGLGKRVRLLIDEVRASIGIVPNDKRCIRLQINHTYTPHT